MDGSWLWKLEMVTAEVQRPFQLRCYPIWLLWQQCSVSRQLYAQSLDNFNAALSFYINYEM